MTTQSDIGASPASGLEERHLPRSVTQIHIPQSSQKPARLSRISSYIGLGSMAKSHAATAIEQNRERAQSHPPHGKAEYGGPRDQTGDVWKVLPDPEEGFIFREADKTWHNPNLTQMMDTVSSAILSRGISEPIPRHLNSFVVGMVEEVRILLGQQSTLQIQFDNLRKTREKEIQEFAAMADEWKNHEVSYKAEVKRLEQIIAANDGMHSVLAARAGSVYNRSDSQAFQAKLNRLSENDGEFVLLSCFLLPHRTDIQPQRRISTLTLLSSLSCKGRCTTLLYCLLTKTAVCHSSSDLFMFTRCVLLMTNLIEGRKFLLERNPDAFTSKAYVHRAGAAQERSNSSECMDDRMTAAQHFLDNNGRPPLPSPRVISPQRSQSTISSGAAPSSTSSSVVGQDLLAAQDHLTPHTSPPHPEPVNPCADAIEIQPRTVHNVLQTIQELARINGGLPENAVDDESSYASSAMLARRAPTASIDQSDPSNATLATLMNGDNVASDDSVHKGPQRLRSLTPRPTTQSQAKGLDSDVPCDFRLQTLKRDDSTGSATSPSSCRSATLAAMAHNCVNHAGHSGGPDCPRNSPTKATQSGTDPFPDGPTKQKFRTERTVLNAHMRKRSYMTNQELRDVLDDRNFRNKQKSRGAPVELEYIGDAYRAQVSERHITCPPGFEGQEAAGLLPYQQAAAQEVADATGSVAPEGHTSVQYQPCSGE